MTTPDFIKCIRMLRAERGLTYNEAVDQVVAFFTKKGWPLPGYFSGKS